MRINQNLLIIAVLFLLIGLLFLTCAEDTQEASSENSVADDDDDDDDNDDDDNNDDDNDDDNECDSEQLCHHRIELCNESILPEDCTQWYGNPDNCLGMPFLVDCECSCLVNDSCSDFFTCLEACGQTHCIDPADLPSDPPVPAIPAQKQVPPTVTINVSQTAEGMEISGGGLVVSVQFDPFSFKIIRTQDGQVLIETDYGATGSKFAPISFTENIGFYWNQFYWGYEGYIGIDKPWIQSERIVLYQVENDRVSFGVKPDNDSESTILFVAGPFYDQAVRIATSIISDKGSADRLAFNFLSPLNERYVGFGERFNHIDQRGHTLRSWLEEGSIEPGVLRPILEILQPGLPAEWALPGGETATYAPIPFYISNKGYGLLADVPEPSEFDLASTDSDFFNLKVASDQLSAVVFAGPKPANVLEQYTERTGRSQTPRHWVLAPWNMFVGYPGQNWLNVAEAFRDADIPSSVSHCWTDITPTGGWRGNEAGIINSNLTLHNLGYKSLCYLQPRIDKDRYTELWDEGVALGHFTKDAAGNTYVQSVLVNLVSMTQFYVSHVDFTHAGADAWWHSILQTILDLDFDGTMYDFAEYTPPDAWFADGNNGHYWHNPYPVIYQRSGHDFFSALDDDPADGIAPDYVYFHRSAYVGSQNWTYAMWSGDPEADWSVSDGLPAQVCAGINAGLSGLPFWGSDIGGFHAILVPAPTSELLKRWVQFGAFSGLMRDMTAAEFTSGNRVLPFDEDEVTYIVRRYQKLRTQLVPYIFNAARQAHETGMPLMRAPLLHFPGDPAVWDVQREYMFGPDIYVAPIIEEGATQRTLYLPQGSWVNLWELTEYDGNIAGLGTGGFRLGGAPIQGGSVITVNAPIDEIPLFIRAGAVIPMVDPAVDTFSPAAPPAGVDVVTSEDRAHLLHVWIVADGTESAILADQSTLDVHTDATGVSLTRSAPADDSEIVAQIIWPANLAAPGAASNLTYLVGNDPLTLPAGYWTWDSVRNAVALHGNPGQQSIMVTPLK